MCAATLLSVPCLGAAQAEGKLRAIVVGNSSYEEAPLTNPLADAHLLARTLRELEFEVDVKIDLASDEVDALYNEVETVFDDTDVSVFYFAGHGVHISGENILVSVDSDVNDSASIAGGGIVLSELLESFAKNASGIRIIILDSCRNPFDPNDPEYNGRLSTGFSFVEAPSGEFLVAFSTGAGREAKDSVGGNNSPYASALSNALKVQGSDIYDVFRMVRGAVRASTGGFQIPWITGSIESEYVFSAPSKAPVTQAAENDGPLAIQTNDGAWVTLASILWSYIASSEQPEDLRQFVAAFPESDRRALADQMLQERGLTSVSGAVVDAAPVRANRILDMSGTYVLRESFRVWPETLPATDKGIGSILTRCDELASDPVDPSKIFPGVSLPILDGQRALRACAFDLAADPENPRLNYQMGRVLDVLLQHEWANAFYKRAGNRGYSAALLNLANNLRTGRGQERNLPEAFDYAYQAAQMGNPKGRTYIGSAYAFGRGVEKNVDEGVLWIRLAASMGWPHAVNLLGDMVRTGRGVDKNPEEAIALYQSAAAQGQTTAMANLGRSLFHGDGGPKDERLGLEWLTKSVRLGNRFAPQMLGEIFLSGSETLDPNGADAKTMFETAAERGNAGAYTRLAYLHSEGAFDGKPDPASAYRAALFAKSGHAINDEPFIQSLAASLDESQRQRLEKEVENFVRLNGL